ncbi:MAG: dihydrodipicolinate synthase family protein [Betaproteobacteria bacterium]|nr:dihydrodipicolinate synthase family protein [Betaproteobacteria bacterium]MBI2226913.1 dihydrodipicolinate synthase family protein [Betaproteobacteria bacterium]
MKYRKHEAKEYAKTALKGVWTALPYHFTRDDKLDTAAMAASLEHCISELKVEGHYCSGNVAEFWALTNEERMRAHEINVETAKGRIPLIAGCHHQNPYEVVTLANHAEAIGIDFVIILTPYMAAKCDDDVYEFYRFIAERINIGIVLFNIPSIYHPINEHLAARLAKIPNICGFKQAGPAPSATISLREAVGKELVVSVADETPWLHNLAVMGDQWLLNYCPHLYQVPGYLPIRDYTRAALAGDMNRAVEVARSLNPLRALHAKWITGYGKPTGRTPSAEMKYWMELIGMPGGPVRAPCTELSEEKKQELRADLEATGIVAKAKAPSRKAA